MRYLIGVSNLEYLGIYICLPRTMGGYIYRRSSRSLILLLQKSNSAGLSSFRHKIQIHPSSDSSSKYSTAKLNKMGDQVGISHPDSHLTVLMLSKVDEIRIKPNADGSFVRPTSSFRDFISNEPGSRFPAEKKRYVLYLSPGCPWVRYRQSIGRIGRREHKRRITFVTFC